MWTITEEMKMEATRKVVVVVINQAYYVPWVGLPEKLSLSELEVCQIFT